MSTSEVASEIDLHSLLDVLHHHLEDESCQHTDPGIWREIIQVEKQKLPSCIISSILPNLDEKCKVEIISFTTAVTEEMHSARDLTLWALSILRNLFTVGSDDIYATLLKSDVLNLLCKLITSSDSFIQAAAGKCLHKWIVGCSGEDESKMIMSTLFTYLCSDRGNEKNNVAYLDILIRCFSRDKTISNPDVDKRLQMKRLHLSFLLLEKWKSLFDLYITDKNNSENSAGAVQLYTFLKLLTKLTKFGVRKSDDLLDEGIHNEIILICHHILKALIGGQINGLSFSKALDVIGYCLPYGKCLCTKKSQLFFHIEVATNFLSSINDGLLEKIPLVVGPEQFGSVDYVEGELKNVKECSHKDERKLIFLGLQSMAILSTESKTEEKSLCARIKWLHHMVHTDNNADKTIDVQKWLLDMFDDQDDALIEVLICVFDIVVNYHMMSTQMSQNNIIRWFVDSFQPHRMFLLLLEHCAVWDVNVLLDWITSPETNFLTYLVKYLRFLNNDQSNFKHLCMKTSDHDSDGQLCDVSFQFRRIIPMFAQLCTKIEHAIEKDLIGFNCMPLVRLLKTSSNMSLE